MGVDPGFANLGLACAYLDTFGRPQLLDARVVRTKKAGRKEKRLDEDLRRRLGEISDAVVGYIREHDPALVVFESMAWVRNASASAKMGLAWGAAFAVARAFELATDVYAPKEIKIGCGLKATASKVEVEAAVKEAFKNSPFQNWPTTKIIEHAADAAAAIITAARDERWRVIFKARSGRL